MKPGSLVKKKDGIGVGRLGIFMGLRYSGDYEYAEVMWFEQTAPNGDAVSSIQKDLIEVVEAA